MVPSRLFFARIVAALCLHAALAAVPVGAQPHAYREALRAPSVRLKIPPQRLGLSTSSFTPRRTAEALERVLHAAGYESTGWFEMDRRGVEVTAYYVVTILQEIPRPPTSFFAAPQPRRHRLFVLWVTSGHPDGGDKSPSFDMADRWQAAGATGLTVLSAASEPTLNCLLLAYVYETSQGVGKQRLLKEEEARPFLVNSELWRLLRP